MTRRTRPPCGSGCSARESRSATAPEPAPNVKGSSVSIIRRAFRLTQEEFSERFRIPLGTLRDWEQGRKEPDAAARAYLVVIARNPTAVAEALNPAA